MPATPPAPSALEQQRLAASLSLDARLGVLPDEGTSAPRRPSAPATLASSLYDADRTLTPREEASASFELGDDDDAFVQVCAPDPLSPHRHLCPPAPALSNSCQRPLLLFSRMIALRALSRVLLRHSIPQVTATVVPVASDCVRTRPLPDLTPRGNSVGPLNPNSKLITELRVISKRG